MFGRSKPLPPLTNDAYARWLRAQRPPMPMFLGLSDLEQEALAAMGDEYVAEIITALAGPAPAPAAPRHEAEAAANLLDIAGNIARAAQQHRVPERPESTIGPSAKPQYDDGQGSKRKAQADALAATFGKPAEVAT